MSIEIFLEVATELLVEENNELPPKGEVWFDSQGKIKCHICGKSFNKLSSHIIQVHNMNSVEYKEIFELNRGQKLTSKAMCEYFRNRERQDITKHSYKTQFKDGHKSPKKGKPARLQAILNKPTNYNK